MHTSSISLIASLLGSVQACSRVMYNARHDDRLVIGRSMDFVADTNTTIWAWPAGLERSGGAGNNSYEWTSKYGSISALMYDAVFTDSMNTEGFSGSTLYLGDSEYAKRDGSQPGLFVGMWLQYFMDSYATVEEAVKDVCPGEGGKDKFQVMTKRVVPGIDTVVHVALSDTTGDNVVMEFTKGELQCYHSPNYTVMTNEPSYDQQLAIDAYWGPVANESLPGTGRPADRFARLSHYNKYIPPAEDAETAVSYTAGMIRAVSNPIVSTNLADISKEDVWPTVWRVATDTTDKVIYYESATSPMFFWVDMHDFDLSKKGQTKVLSLVDVKWQDRMGNVTAKFEKADKDDCYNTQC